MKFGKDLPNCSASMLTVSWQNQIFPLISKIYYKKKEKNHKKKAN
jgi:hypothetical protein